jgi:Cu-processing system permease protein
MTRNLGAIAGAVLADAVRRKVLYLILVFAAILAAMIPSLPTYGIGVVAQVYREIALALVFVASLALTLSLAANRVPSEVERRTVYNVLSKRVRRWEYVVGTWLGIALVMAVAIASFTVVTQVVAILRYGDPMWRLWQGALGIWLEMSALAAFSVAVSTVTGPVVVVTASVAFLFAAHARGALTSGTASGLAAYYPSFDTFNVITPVAHGAGISLGYAALMLVVFVAWAAVLLLAGSAAFSVRDL